MCVILYNAMHVRPSSSIVSITVPSRRPTLLASAGDARVFLERPLGLGALVVTLPRGRVELVVDEVLGVLGEARLVALVHLDGNPVEIDVESLGILGVEVEVGLCDGPHGDKHRPQLPVAILAKVPSEALVQLHTQAAVAEAVVVEVAGVLKEVRL